MNLNLRRGNVHPEAESTPADRKLVEAFGSLNPAVAGLPHLVFPNTRDHFRRCMARLRGTPGVWELQVPHDVGGVAFVREDYGPEDFHLWGLRENQQAVERMRNTHLEFQMVMDAGVPVDVLREMAAHPVKDYYSYLEHLPGWMGRLGWAYVALEPEGEMALLVVEPGRSGVVDRVGLELAAQAEGVFRLIRAGGRHHWTLLPPG